MKYKTKQIVVPFYKVPEKLLNTPVIKKQLKERGWREFRIKRKTEAIWSPFYGSNRHMAVVEAKVDSAGRVMKIVRFLFDQIERADGPVKKPFGHSTPSAMVVVIEEAKNHRLFVHSVKEWRPNIYDHKRKKKGIFVTGITGKFAKKTGENPAKTILKGLLEDTGIEIEKASFKRIGMHSPNRAWVETCNEVYIAKFTRKSKRNNVEKNSHDIVREGKVYPLDKFPIGPDALVNSALWMVARYFGLVGGRKQ